MSATSKSRRADSVGAISTPDFAELYRLNRNLTPKCVEDSSENLNPWQFIAIKYFQNEFVDVFQFVWQVQEFHPVIL